MGTLLKGVQSVLIALGIIAVIGTGVVVYYNTVKPPEDETAAIETQSGTETETAAETDSSDAAGTGNETETDGVTDPTMVPVSNGGTASDTFTPENGHEHTYTNTNVTAAIFMWIPFPPWSIIKANGSPCVQPPPPRPVCARSPVRSVADPWRKRQSPC